MLMTEADTMCALCETDARQYFAESRQASKGGQNLHPTAAGEILSWLVDSSRNFGVASCGFWRPASIVTLPPQNFPLRRGCRLRRRRAGFSVSAWYSLWGSGR